MAIEIHSNTQVETARDMRKKATGTKAERSAAQWKQELERAIKYQKDYLKRADKIIARYRVELGRTSGGEQRRYNILWSMVNTLQPNLFMGMPKPYVSRRYRDKDPIARYASLILERALTYVNDSDEMHDAMSSAVDDYILAARGTVWTRYSPEFDLRKSETKKYYEDDDEIPEDAETGEDDKGTYYQESYEEVVNEECETDHVQLVNFIHPPCSQWKQLPWASKRILMGRDELVKRFGALGKDVPLGYRADGSKVDTKNMEPDEIEGMFLQAAVYEIWCKTTKKIYWVCTEFDKVLDTKPDSLQLKNFFPFPRPLYGTMTNNSLIPVPDFKYYESIAAELDDITLRIKLLTEALRVVGFYDGQFGDELKRIFDETEENEMVPMTNFGALSANGGLKKVIEFLPLDTIIVVLQKLYEARTNLVQELYEITGMSDIVRGTSDPRETAAAQKIKGSYASKRLVRRQKAVARFAREHLEIQAEIICKHYDDETILRISSADQFIHGPDGQFDPKSFKAAVDLLRDNPLRLFRIKIDNETLAGDEMEANREQGVNFLTSISQLVGTVTPLAQQNPQLAGVMKELVLFGVRLFPVARSVEGQIESALEDLAKNIQPPPQPEKDPKMSPEQEFELRMKEIKIREREIGIREKELALKDWETRWNVHNQSKKIVMDAEARKDATSTQERIADKTLGQKDKADARKLTVDVQKHDDELSMQRDRDDREFDHRDADRETAHTQEVDRAAREGAQHEHEVERDALDFAERRADRDSGDERHRMTVEANKEKAAQAAKAKKGKSNGAA
jgi:hypothetical protein